ncbi:MAG: FmdB family zinc ribbon protein [Desulfobacteraceae bacterium]
MPIYEFYCSNCHMLFDFYSGSVNTDKRPVCPRCRRVELERRMSVFSTLRRRGDEDNDNQFPDMDEDKLKKAMGLLAQEAQGIDEEDPRKAAQLMRKLSDMTGMELGPGFQEALSRMEAGEEPEQVEADMGDVLEQEDPFEAKKKVGGMLRKILPPRKDDHLYDL